MWMKNARIALIPEYSVNASRANALIIPMKIIIKTLGAQ